MTRLKTAHFAISVLLASTALAAVVPAQAQPMMGDTAMSMGMGMHPENGHMHEQMSKQMEKRQAELKAKLHLAAAQEAAWNTYVQATKPPAKPLMQTMDREALAKLTTPERLDKINAAHEANLKAMEQHMKQRSDATREFYGHLSAEQQKIFDAETLTPAHGMMGEGRKGRPN